MNFLKWYMLNDSTAVASVPKCASSSIHEVFYPEPGLEQVNILEVENRIAWIRHPTERLISAYSNFAYHRKTLGVIPKPKDGSKLPLTKKSLESWEGWVDHILEKRNIHWQPQVEILTQDGELVPNVLHRFEDFADTWRLYSEIPMLHFMQCDHEKVTEYRADELTALYEADFKLWEGIEQWQS